MFDYSTPFNTEGSSHNKMYSSENVGIRRNYFCSRPRNRMNLNREPHEPRPLTTRTVTANRTNRSRKPHEPQPQTARTATEPHVLSYF